MPQCHNYFRPFITPLAEKRNSVCEGSQQIQFDWQSLCLRPVKGLAVSLILQTGCLTRIANADNSAMMARLDQRVISLRGLDVITIKQSTIASQQAKELYVRGAFFDAGCIPLEYGQEKQIFWPSNNYLTFGRWHRLIVRTSTMPNSLIAESLIGRTSTKNPTIITQSPNDFSFASTTRKRTFQFPVWLFDFV